MKIKVLILILCMFLLISCTDAMKYTEVEDDYYGITENIEEKEEVTSDTYLLNVSSKKIHYIHCGTGQRTKEKNRDYFTGDIDDLFTKGYTVCGNCFN